MGKQMLLVAALAAAAVKGVAAKEIDVQWAQMHGWLMWASFGFLFPLGTLLIRYSRPQRDPAKILSPGRVMLMFYLHCIIMCVAVVAATAGVSILIRQDGGSWNFTHQRLGLALLIIVCMQPFVGLFRPGKGRESRPYWFVVHWVFGTGVLFLGIINCYIGINAYQHIFHRNIRSLVIAFSCQVSFMTVAYFLQDRWNYILGQRKSENSKLTVRVSQTVGIQSL